MACFVREASPRSHDGGPSSSPIGRWWTKRGTHEAGLTVGRQWMDPQPLTAARTARAGAERRTDPGSDRWGGSLARPNPIGDRPMQRVHCRDRHCSSCAAAVQLGTPDRADGGWGCVHNQRNTEGQASGDTCPRVHDGFIAVPASTPGTGIESCTAVLPKIPHCYSSKSVPNPPLQGRRGRFATLVQQLQCGTVGLCITPHFGGRGGRCTPNHALWHAPLTGTPQFTPRT